jgi:hypothetical protein
VFECDLEGSILGRPWHIREFRAMEKKTVSFSEAIYIRRLGWLVIKDGKEFGEKKV